MKLTFLLLFMAFGAFARVDLSQINDFGSNPGNLKMYVYTPKTPIKGLVVLLHGCAQAATDFDDETGWTKVAEEYGFMLLLPQQTEMNNSMRCFNWFESGDISRGQGEAESISEMVSYLRTEKGLEKVYINGLSAGAAMSNVMLATYPELFTAGAIVAGIPYGCATSQMNAWTCMYGFQFPAPSAQQRGDLVRSAAGPYSEEWPRVIVVHGKSDEFVSFKNAGFNVDQWTNVHGIDNQADKEIDVQGTKAQVFQDKNGKTKVALIGLNGVRHGYPVDSSAKCGYAGKYILDVKFCAAEAVTKFFLENY